MTPNDTRPSFLRRWWPVGLALALVLLRVLLPARALEYGYSQGVFVGLREVWDRLVGWFPFPLYYVFWALVAGWLIAFGLRIWRGRGCKGSWWRRGRELLNAVATLVVVFLLGWGFNYGRPAVTDYAGFAPYAPTLDELRARVRSQAAALAELRAALTTDTVALGADYLTYDRIDAVVRPLVTGALRELGYPAPGRPAVRLLYPRGVLLRFSTAGVYWPWVGEGNLDAGLHPLQLPAVAAHEMTHAYGFGDEGTCTFVAWLAGRRATDPALRYAFGLAYWRRIAGKLRQVEPDAYWAWRAAELDPGVRNDLQAIYDNRALYQDIAPALRNAAYDHYLKAQGIREGLLNYGTVVQLVEGYRRRGPE